MKAKRSLSFLVILAGLFVAGISQGQGTIVGSDHDLTGLLNTADICGVCHTPHNAIDPSPGPLWDHELTIQTFALYSSPTLDATGPADNGLPGTISRLCLGCHDGTIALDSYGPNPGSTMMGAGPALLGTDLSGSHPIGITYDDALANADGGLFLPTGAPSGLGRNIDQDMLFGLNNDQVECASCHDVHDPSLVPFLILDNDASALCLTCHNK